MKINPILITLIICMFSSFTYAGGPFESNGDDTKLNLWIPGCLIKMAANIAGNHVEGDDAMAVEFIHKIGNMNICIREGAYYSARTDKKVTRKLNRMEKKDYEQLVSVFTENEKVNISIREKNGKIKRMVVIVDEKDETYVYLKMNCRIDPEDISKLAGNYSNLIHD